MRFALNKSQRIVLLVVAAAIVFVQLAQFAEDGVQGYGWILSFLAAGMLLLLALFRGGQITVPDVSLRIPPKEGLNKIHAGLRENAEILAIEVEEEANRLARELIHDKDNTMAGLVHTIHGSEMLGNQFVKQLNLHIRERCLFLMLGLVGMRRSKGDKLYITGIEFKTVQEKVSKKILETAVESQKISPLPVDFDPQALARSVMDDLQLVRKSITAYCIGLESQTPNPEAALLDWFQKSCGINLTSKPHIAQVLARRDA